MKILFVGMPESIHTVRWIAQIQEEGWEVHLFPSTYVSSAKREIKNVTIHHFWDTKTGQQNKLVKFKGLKLQFRRAITFFRWLRDKINPESRAKQLAQLIQEIEPDIVHSLEIQTAGDLTYRAKKYCPNSFPSWVATNWGSDIYWFRHDYDKRLVIKKVLSECDFYSCECQRDVCLAEQFGLKGQVLPVLPNSGGFDLKKIKSWQKPLEKRNLILLKGKYDLWGRPLLGLDALKIIASEIKKYTVVIYAVAPRSKVIQEALNFQQETGVKTKIVLAGQPHEKILKLHGQARVSLGLSLSDAVSTSFLESLVMGSFPIQTNTACADEWVINRKTGILVDSNDTLAIVKALRLVLNNDGLVKNAAKINWQTAQKKLDYQFVKKQILKSYDEILKSAPDNDKKNHIKPNWRFWGLRFLFRLFFIVWAGSCLIIWFFINTYDINYEFGLTGKVPVKVESFIRSSEKWFDQNYWIRQYVWRTFK